MSGDDVPPVEIPPEMLAAIYRQARAEFPKECCGYVLGAGADAELVACENFQDKLHALDPETWPRTGENGYQIYGKALRRLVDSFDGPKPATLVYHSHPRVGAYFSREDTDAAIAAGLPVDYLVIDVQDDEVRGAVRFRRQGEAYVEVARYDGAPV
jgi:[CysO sulfur-carrier protein]-S-L-cysteine hydrolase